MKLNWLQGQCLERRHHPEKGTIIANDSWQGRPFDDLYAASDGTQSPPLWSQAIDRFVDASWLQKTWVLEHNGFSGVDQDDDTPGSKAADVLKSFVEPGAVCQRDGHRTWSDPSLFLLFCTTTDETPAPTLPRRTATFGRDTSRPAHVPCERHSGEARQNCTAVQQRLSRRPHSPETILSSTFPTSFTPSRASCPRR